MALVQTTREAPSWKILSVDDDLSFQEALKFSLSNLVLLDRRIELLTANSVAEALTLLNTLDDIAVILLDVVMESNHAGFDLARQIRLDANLGDMRIILLTGQPGVAPVDKVMTELDLTDYCLKSDLVKRGLKNVLLGPLRSYRDITKLSRTTHDRWRAQTQRPYEADVIGLDAFV